MAVCHLNFLWMCIIIKAGFAGSCIAPIVFRAQYSLNRGVVQREIKRTRNEIKGVRKC